MNLTDNFARLIVILTSLGIEAVDNSVATQPVFADGSGNSSVSFALITCSTIPISRSPQKSAVDPYKTKL